MSAQGKRALVIGGETTAGRAIAIGLAEAGADVAIASLTTGAKAEFAINSALNELWAIGRKGIALAIDASDIEQVRAAIIRAEAELGPLDAIIAITGDATELRAAFPDRAVLAVAPEAGPTVALAEVILVLDN
jgi:NAD(P)-dependent dehydrogenase (short-subunit alcohol dehydrogenase family)